jgi:putative nucleotidyltransferase with HDIG domain
MTISFPMEMVKTSLEDLVAKAGGMRAIPAAARKVLDLVDDEQASSAVLGEALSKDQALAAHVLKVANSALYGCAREITTLTMAVSVLGRKAIRNQIIVVTTRGVYRRFGITEKMLWSHAVSTAIGARLVAKKSCPAVAEDAFVCGLMHDVGKVILNNECPDLFADVMMRTYNDGEPYLQAEKQLFGYSHTQVGALVTRRWNYPAMISSVAFHHHRDEEPGPALEDAGSERILACVDLSNTICKIVGAGYREPQADVKLETRPSLQLLKVSPEQIPALIAEAQEAFAKESAGWA